MLWLKPQPTKPCNAVFGFSVFLIFSVLSVVKDFPVSAGEEKTFNTGDTEKIENTEKWPHESPFGRPGDRRASESHVTNYGHSWAARFPHFGNWSTTPSRAGRNSAARCAARIRNISTACFAACAPTRRRPRIRPATTRWKPSCSPSRSIRKNGWTRSSAPRPGRPGPPCRR